MAAMEGSTSRSSTNTANAAGMSADVVAMLRARDEQIAAQGEQIAALKRQLDWFRRQVFGSKSERFIAEPNPAQLHLGEALPVEKSDVPAADSPVPVTELATLCFMGTSVVTGAATAVVAATAARTSFGSMAKGLVGRRTATAFDIGVNKVSWLLIRFMAVMVPIVFFINGLTKGNWLEAFLFGLAVAVGLTPEMLPMIVSAHLAKGARVMSKRKVIVKRLNAIQNNRADPTPPTVSLSSA